MENGLEQSEVTGRETNQEAAAVEQLRDHEGLSWAEVQQIGEVLERELPGLRDLINRGLGELKK